MFDSFEENYTNKASEDYQQEYDHDDDEHINEYINVCNFIALITN